MLLNLLLLYVGQCLSFTKFSGQLLAVVVEF